MLWYNGQILNACRTALFVFVFMGIVGAVRGQAVSVKSGDWSDPETWEGGEVPGQGAEVEISGGDTVTYSGSANVFKGLRIHSNATLAIGAGVFDLKISKDISNDGILLFYNSETSYGNIRVTGNSYWLGTGIWKLGGIIVDADVTWDFDDNLRFEISKDITIGTNSLVNMGSVQDPSRATVFVFTGSAPSTITSSPNCLYPAITVDKIGTAPVTFHNSGGYQGPITVYGTVTIKKATDVLELNEFNSFEFYKGIIGMGSIKGAPNNSPFIEFGNNKTKNLRIASGSVVLSADLTVTDTFSLSSESSRVSLNDKKLFLTKSPEALEGSFIGSETSELRLAKVPSTITLNFSPGESGSGLSLGTLAVNNSGSSSIVAIGSDLTISTALVNTSASNRIAIQSKKSLTLLGAYLGDGTLAGSSEARLIIGSGDTTQVRIPFFEGTNFENIQVLRPSGAVFMNNFVVLDELNVGAECTAILQDGSLKLGEDGSSGRLALDSGANFAIGNGKLILNGSFLAKPDSYITGSENAQLEIGEAALPENLTLAFNPSSASAHTLKRYAQSRDATVTLANALNISDRLDLTGSSSKLESYGNLTLLSTVAGNAVVGKLSGGAEIVGDVNVQSFFTGGSIAFRNNRGVSPPINDAGLEEKVYKQLQKSVFITGVGNIANGFDMGGNVAPNATTIQMYNESALPTVSQYTTIDNINESATPGSGFFLFFRGNRSDNATSKLNAPYAVPEDVTVTYTGPINRGTINIPLSYTDHEEDNYVGYNLVGNPYPATIDWKKVRSASSQEILDKVMILKAGGGFATYFNGLETNGGAQYIQTGQAFYVQASGTGQSITFTEDAKVTENNIARYLDAPDSSNKMSRPVSIMSTGNGIIKPESLPKLLRFRLQDAMNSDEVVIAFESSANSEYDPREDALYFGGSTVSLSSFSSDNKSLAINFMTKISKVAEVRLNVNATGTGTVSLDFTDLSAVGDYDVFLKDDYTHQVVDVRAQSKYSFTINKGVAESFGPNRFVLLFKRKAKPPVEFVTLSGKMTGKTAQLNWSILNENEDIHFEVQHSIDGKLFLKIGEIQGRQDESSYSFTDENPSAGVNYYRIKQAGLDQAVLSDVLKLDSKTGVKGSKVEVTVYPNPVSHTLRVSLINSSQTEFGVNIFDIDGRKVKSTMMDAIDVQPLDRGVYVLEAFDLKNRKVIGRTRFLKE